MKTIIQIISSYIFYISIGLIIGYFIATILGKGDIKIYIDKGSIQSIE